ncbi:MAG TPA: TonB-dependent receptor [Burkholderiales bacterium]|nr:TonB-dependent receptor [Burkholderiales bacterium]
MCLAVLAATLFASTLSCRGQDLAALPVLPPVEVNGSYQESIGAWDAASQGAATREVIEKRPILRPAEVLENVPGVTVTQHSGDGKANQYFLRGYNLDHGTDFATWVAGMPVNMPTHAHGQGYTDLNFLIPELISRIVYSKGPYFAEDGDFSSAGSARILYAERLPSSVASLTGGSFGYGRGVLAGSPELGAGRLVYGLEYQHSDGPWDNPNRFHKVNGVLRYAQGSEPNGFNVTGMAYRASWNSTDQIPQRAVDSGLIGLFGAIDPTDGGRSERYSLSGEWRQSEGGINRAANFYLIRSRLNLFSNFTYFLDNPARGDQFEQAEKRFIAGGSASQTWFMKSAERQIWNTLGAQVRRDRIEPVGLYSTVARERLATTRQDDVIVTSVAPYFSNTIVWTSWLRTIAGIRADYADFDVSSDNPANSGRAHDFLWSPKLSLIFGPWAKTEYFANIGRGFHSNDARGATITVDPKTGDPAQRVDPLVRTFGYEGGVRSELAKGLTASAALWRLTQDSELLFVGDAGTTEPSRPSRRHGLELLAQYLPRLGLALDLSLALTHARFRDDDPAGNYIPGAPDRVASAGVTIESGYGWFGALRWRYFGPRPLIEDNSVRSKSTSLVNARVGYAFSKKVKVQFDVFNLFDRKDHDIDYFYASRLPGEPAGGVNDVHFHPVESRALRATLSVAY